MSRAGIKLCDRNTLFWGDAFVIRKKSKDEAFFSTDFVFALCIISIWKYFSLCFLHLSNVIYSVSSIRLNFFGVFVRSILSFCVLLALVRNSIGIFLIPLLMYIRGFVLGLATYSIMQVGQVDIIEYLFTMFFQVFGFFCVSVCSFCLSIRRVKGVRVSAEELGELKRSLLYALLAAFLGSIFAELINF